MVTLSRGAAGQRPARGDRRGDPRPPGRDRRRRDRVGQDHADPEDLPRARARRPRTDRPHPAAPDRRAHRGRAHQRRARRRAGRRGRLPGPLHRPRGPHHPGQADDRRHPARRAAPRPGPDAYDTVIIDEAHERSLNIDFILGYLKQLLPRRPDLKVVITSATIDPQRFAAHFADASGRPRADRGGLRAHLPGRGALPTAGRGALRRRGRRAGRARPDRGGGRRLPGAGRRGARGRPGLPPRRAGDPRHRRRAGRGDLARRRLRRSCRCSRGSPAPSSTGSSPPTPGAASCWPPTSPRPR